MIDDYHFFTCIAFFSNSYCYNFYSFIQLLTVHDERSDETILQSFLLTWYIFPLLENPYSVTV